MKLRIFNLNIWKGRFLGKIIGFLQKNDFDILHFQEVSGGLLSYKGIDTFSEISANLPYLGELAVYVRQLNRPDTYMGNAIFYKPTLRLVNKNIIWLREFQEVNDAKDVNWETCSRNALSLEFKIQSAEFTSVTTHLAWSRTPFDTPEKISQGAKLIEYIEGTRSPYLLTGDFNVNKDSLTIQKLSGISNNISVKAGITNTLDLKLHTATDLPPLGLAVDYAFAGKKMNSIKTEVLSGEHLSDHLAQIIELVI